MNNQEAFTRIVTHLRQQGAQSVAGGWCLYRDIENRRRCSVGVLITDEFYRPWMEGKAITDSEIRCILHMALPDVSFELLHRMQLIHDRKIFYLDVWETEFRAVAISFDLTMPEVEVQEVRVVQNAYLEKSNKY